MRHWVVLSRSLIRIRRHFNRQKIILLRFQSYHSPHSNCLFVARVSHSVMDLSVFSRSYSRRRGGGVCKAGEGFKSSLSGAKVDRTNRTFGGKEKKKGPKFILRLDLPQWDCEHCRLLLLFLRLLITHFLWLSHAEKTGNRLNFPFPLVPLEMWIYATQSDMASN